MSCSVTLAQSVVPALCMLKDITQGTGCSALALGLISSLWRASLQSQTDSLVKDQILDFELLLKDLIQGNQ